MLSTSIENKETKKINALMLNRFVISPLIKLLEALFLLLSSFFSFGIGISIFIPR